MRLPARDASGSPEASTTPSAKRLSPATLCATMRATLPYHQLLLQDGNSALPPAPAPGRQQSCPTTSSCSWKKIRALSPVSLLVGEGAGWWWVPGPSIPVLLFLHPYNFLRQSGTWASWVYPRSPRRSRESGRAPIAAAERTKTSCQRPPDSLPQESEKRVKVVQSCLSSAAVLRARVMNRKDGIG